MWIGAVLLVLGGCKSPGALGMDKNGIRTPEQEKQFLADSARIYWEGVRWGDAERSSNFIEGPDDRGVFRSRFEDRREQERVVDAEILRVRVIPVEGADEGALMMGEVLLRVEAYALPAQVLKDNELEQAWYRTAGGWWLTWDPDDEAPSAIASD